jgi:hypothetical protein
MDPRSLEIFPWKAKCPQIPKSQAGKGFVGYFIDFPGWFGFLFLKAIYFLG